MDPLRMYQVQIFGFVGTVVVVLIIEGLVRYFMKFADGEKEEKAIVKTWIGCVRNIVIVLALIGFGWSAISMATQNQIPRKVLDRSGLQDQINKDR